MRNFIVELADRPGALADVAEALGSAGVSIEGGGMFVIEGRGFANFLLDDWQAGQNALKSAEIPVLRVDKVLLQRLNQDEPGQLGQLLRRMAQAGVNLMTQYSDHHHQLVLVVDDSEAAQAVSDAWMQERSVIRSSEATGASAKKRTHLYALRVDWTGNKGLGTVSYASYARDHEISAPEKPTISGSSDPAFRGDGSRYNPEELLIASASSCHMLSYLHLCAVNGVVVSSYEDLPTGEMEEVVGGRGAFVRVDLHPTVAIASASDAGLAEALHDEAHRNCFIANSLKVAVDVHPTITRTSPSGL